MNPNSPKAQAEAMVDDIFTQGPYLISTAKRNQLVTALEKLLTENEKAQKKVDQYFTGLISAERAFQETQSQLTATEAKLETAKGYLQHHRTCNAFSQGIWECTCGLDQFRADLILSTITAAKKEQTKC